jgi:hypothetical protein
MQVKRVVCFCFSFLLFFTNISALFIDGTSSPSYQSQNIVFSGNDTAVGFVKFNDGFTVMPDETVTLSIHPPISGRIDLRNTGILALGEDLFFDSNLTLSTGGVVDGKGFAIILNNDLLIPASSTLSFTSDTIIDGQGHNIKLDNGAQLYIESNITLTLKNVKLRNVLNTQIVPPIKLKDSTSKLALNNIELAFVDDFYFDNGQLFIHNDVVISGTSQFNYMSPDGMFINSNSILYLDMGVSFSYAPLTGTNRDLIHMEDETSRLFLDGVTLKSSTTGMRLTKGTLVVDHKNYFESGATSVSEAISFGDGTTAHDLDIEIMPGGSIWFSSGILDYNNVN